MQAELMDGSIVELQKDCDCVTHAGPHWLHMDGLWRAMNQALLQPETARAWDAFVNEDLARLRVKRIEMERFGIKRLIENEAA